MKIILVVDHSARSERAVVELAAHPWPPDTVVRVLAVVDNTPPSAAELLFDAGGSLQTVMQLRKEQCRQLADEAAARLRARGLTVETSVRPAPWRRAVREETKQWSADVVIPDRGLCRFRPWTPPSRFQ